MCSMSTASGAGGGSALAELVALDGEGEAGMQGEAGEVRGFGSTARLNGRHEAAHLVVVLPHEPCHSASHHSAHDSAARIWTLSIGSNTSFIGS